MGTKVFFVGNVLGGDDGIGPYLYHKLKKEKLLKEFELIEIGVLGLDMIGYVGDNDNLIIVDAVHAENNIGSVEIIDETELVANLELVSQHDFGVEETSRVLRAYKPNLKAIKVIGINVKKINAFNNTLSAELMGMLNKIKSDVVKKIIKIAEEN